MLSLIASEDGEIRRCSVRTANGITTRAISHSYPLEISVEEYISPESFESARKIVQQEEGDDFTGFNSRECVAQ